MIPAKGNFVSVNYQYLYLMFRSTLVFFILLTTQFLSAQNLITGRVCNKKGNPVPGTNVYIDKTYDGASTDVNGVFSFKSNTSGKQTLVVSCIGFVTSRLSKPVKDMQNLQIRLKESVNSLNAVMITAGTFSAGDNTKISVLKPIDVVTTAGAAGNYIAAFKTLPGTTTVGESGELFIRGGNSYESQTFIDGMRVFKPYTASANNNPSRARYSPMLFKGTTFSTGGYSAEYGQALSGVLLLDTKDNPIEESSEISIMTVGAGLGQVIKKDKDALTVNASYTNLAPYNKLNASKQEWEKLPEKISGEAVYRHQFNKGLLKFYTAYDKTQFHILQKGIDYAEKLSYNTKEKDLYLNTSYNGSISETWLLKAGASYSNNHNKEKIDSISISNKEKNGHIKFKLKHVPNENIKLSIGTEYFFTDANKNISLSNPTWEQNYNLKNQLAAIFTESNILFTKNTALTVGLRGEYADYSESFHFSPRISVGQKISEHGQLSFAWGEFYQLPQNKNLQLSKSLKEEKSQQYLFNYHYNNDKRILRAELYYKKYTDLMKYELTDNNSPSNFNNTGSGYAQGLDLYWKDEKTFKNFEYWISYSYLDTKRDYKAFPEKAASNFSNKHNLSVVGKYWIGKLRSLIGISYNFASGRPYNDPNSAKFMSRETQNYNNLSLNWSWLISQQTIFYCSATNILGHNNIYNYDYSNKPNSAGQFERQAITPDTKHFFFAGLFITISKNKKKNQLKNL